MDARNTGGGAARDPRAELMAALRRLRPAKLRAVVEGEARDVAIPASKRHRWESVARVLDSLPWSRLEALDAKGALLGIIEGDGDEPDEAQAAALLADPPKGLDREHGLLTLLLRAQDVALRHQAAVMRTVVEGHQALVGMMGERLASHEAALDKVLALAHQAAVRVSGGEPEDANDRIVADLISKVTSGGGMDEKRLESLVERVGKRLLTPAAPSAAANGKGA